MVDRLDEGRTREVCACLWIECSKKKSSFGMLMVLRFVNRNMAMAMFVSFLYLQISPRSTFCPVSVVLLSQRVALHSSSIVDSSLFIQ